ncbi:MAG: hypothetical protein NTW27_09350 [Deltaproteobacteria bacterium]|nr:hypothetical protein [Deltaproteobacteria bacterium]
MLLHTLRTPNVLPILIILSLVIPNIYWIYMDNSLWLWDQAFYGETTVRLWWCLTNNPLAWPKQMLMALGAKAPGIVWFGQFFVPFGQIFGSMEFGLLLSIIFFQVLTLWFSYDIGREFFPDRPYKALLAPLIVCSAPLFVGMGHEYLVETMQLCAVTYIWRLSAVSYKMSSMAIITHLLLATNLAMLAKLSSPIYSLGPGILIAYDFIAQAKFRSKPSSSKPVWNNKFILTFGVMLTIGTVSWYLFNFRQLFAFARLAASSEIALYYGKIDSYFNKMEFWFRQLQSSLFIAEIFISMILVIILFLTLKMLIVQEILGCSVNRRLRVLSVLAALHVIGVLTVFSLNINESPRYLLPLLPSIMTLFLFIVSFVQTRVLVVSIGLMCCFQWVIVISHAFGFPRKTAIHTVSRWVSKYDRASDKKDEIRKLLNFLHNKQADGNSAVFVAVDTEVVNQNTMDFYAAVEMLNGHDRVVFLRQPYDEKDADREWNRMNHQTFFHVLTLDAEHQKKPPVYANWVSLSILEKMEHDRNYYKEDFESKFGIVVYKRILY